MLYIPHNPTSHGILLCHLGVVQIRSADRRAANARTHQIINHIHIAASFYASILSVRGKVIANDNKQSHIFNFTGQNPQDALHIPSSHFLRHYLPCPELSPSYLRSLDSRQQQCPRQVQRRQLGRPSRTQHPRRPAVPDPGYHSFFHFISRL